MKSILGITLPIAVLFVLAAFWNAGAQQQPSNVPETGRYQIVNGTPTSGVNIMLLDTWTGRTWITCTESVNDDTVKLTAWCTLPQSTGRSGVPK